jgi:serine/threonine protein kinase
VVRAGDAVLQGALLESLHEQLAATLASLHGAGIVHRDVHPDNVYLVLHPTARRAPITEQWAFDHFGDARGRDVPRHLLPAENDGDSFLAAWVLGDPTFAVLADEQDQTPVRHGTYTPPEQEAGRATQASDLFAFGATLYYAISGIAPPSLRSPGASHRLEIPRARHSCFSFDAYIRSLLSAEPDDRPPADEPLRYSTMADDFCGVLTVDTERHLAMTSFSLTTRLFRDADRALGYRRGFR